jgi:hypothetical protein
MATLAIALRVAAGRSGVRAVAREIIDASAW